jgi:lipid-A-disaccharide synthase
MKINPRIFVSAGEASGDHYGAELILELRRRLAGATFFGLGGTEMEAAGFSRVVKAEDVAVMGITEILRHIPRIYASYRRLVAAIKRDKPDVAVLIDFPDVNFRLAKHCKRMGIPVVWFVSPQLWAWKRQRLRWVQKRVARMMVIFPFEAAFYKARGVDAEFVGHPLAALPLPASSRQEYAAKYGLDASKQWIALLPGSRWKEVHANLPEMMYLPFMASTPDDEGLSEMLGVTRPSDSILDYGVYEFLLPVASTINRVDMQELLEKLTLQARRYSQFTDDDYRVRLVDDAREAMWHARASVVASGTATVQALLIGNPFVVVYRVSKTTFALAKRLVKYPVEIPAPVDEVGNLPIAMVNLIAGKRIVPELINERFTAQSVAAALKPLITDGAERDRMVRDLREARERLFVEGDATPVERVADAVLGVLGLG